MNQGSTLWQFHGVPGIKLLSSLGKMNCLTSSRILYTISCEQRSTLINITSSLVPRLPRMERGNEPGDEATSPDCYCLYCYQCINNANKHTLPCTSFIYNFILYSDVVHITQTRTIDIVFTVHIGTFLQDIPMIVYV